MKRLPLLQAAMPPALTIVAAFLVIAAHADPAPTVDKPFVASLFTDNMVLQRGISDPVWGWTTPGAAVTVTIDGKTAQAVAGTDGEYIAKLPKLSAGGPYTLSVIGPKTVTGPQTVTFSNVLVGEVWICSGQSNMEFGVGNGNNAPDEITAADYPQIRLFVVDKKVARDPQSGTVGSWLPCSPDSIKRGTWNGFSAVGYFFGRNLYQNLHVPIGLIQSSWGGTPAEAWTDEAALAQNVPGFKATLMKIDAQRDAEKQGLTASSTPPLPALSLDQNSPTSLYNGMIAPIIPYGIKGAIWYQGEANAGRARQYRVLLPTMIDDWRTQWGEGNFPFYIVQLAGWQPGGDSWADLREAQWLTAKNETNSGIATAIDIGDQNDIHPKNKQEVGRRLALVAEAKTYREKVEYSGPVYKSMKVEGGTIRLSFDHLGGGLTAKDPTTLTGFTISGADLNFVPADAKIDGDTVVVSSAQVPNPTAVRYAWSAYPDCSLFSQNSLPAFPFRTDPDVAPVAIALPANAGPNLALGMPVVASDPNKWGWDTGLTDGSWDPGSPTTWASGVTDSFPKTATIDLQTPANVGIIAMGVPPFGSTKTVTVSVSADGQTFTDVGSYVFSLRKEEKHLFTFPPVLARFIRLTYPDHYPDNVGYDPNFVFTTEVEVYAPGK